VLGLMSMLLVTRHTRQEEETGRAELVSAGVVGRYAWLAAGLLYVLAVNVVLAALTAIGYLALGLPAAGSVALAVGGGLCGLVFAGVAAICMQLTEHIRAANGMAFAVLGVAFLLRAVGDSASGLSWLAWLSPIGWAERFPPFAGERRAVLALPVALLLVLLAVVAALVARRDIGAGVLPARASGRTAGQGPGLAAQPPWAGLAVAARVAGRLGRRVGGGRADVRGIAQDIVQFAAQDPETAKALASLGGPGASPTSTWPRSCPGSACSPPATPARRPCGCAARRPSSGPSRCWPPPPPGRLGGRPPAGGGGRLGGGAGHRRAAGRAGPWPAVRRPGRPAARVLGAALVQLPAVWVMAAVAAALFGLAPRLVVGLTWAVLAAVLFVTIFGEPLQLSQPLLDLSPFAHLPRLPAAAFTATPLVWLLAVAALLAAAGLAAFRRRDLLSSA